MIRKAVILGLVTMSICALICIYSVCDDEGEADCFVIDSDDLTSFRSENWGRAAMSSYEDRADLFMNKALADDDRDGDGVSTLDNCVEWLKEHRRPEIGLAEFTLEYIHENFRYASDSEVYSSFEWAAYPVETIGLGAGDCEDLVILLVSLLDREGYDCGMVLFHDHVVAIVAIGCGASIAGEGFAPFSIDMGGTTYVAFETTANCPTGYTFDEYGPDDVLATGICSSYRTLSP